jgi:hypothetical protein
MSPRTCGKNIAVLYLMIEHALIPAVMHPANNAFSNDTQEGGESWFVYLLPLMDGSAFKVGYSCNPIQRVYSFNHRYYERFDISDSLLLKVAALADARAIEANLKQRFAACRAPSPVWVNEAAGGHTEWFDASCLDEARTQLQISFETYNDASLIAGYDFVRDQLSNLLAWFELWAIDQAKQLQADFESVRLGYAPTINPAMLRDWFDAYRFFDVPLFVDDPAALEFTLKLVRS